jgi:hypothetical protein
MKLPDTLNSRIELHVRQGENTKELGIFQCDGIYRRFTLVELTLAQVFEFGRDTEELAMIIT